MIAENIWAEANGTPTRYEIARWLMDAPTKVEKAEGSLYIAKQAVVHAKESHDDQEARIISTIEDPKAFGGNAEQRAARIRVLLEPYRAAVRRAEASALDAERAYNREVNEFRALRAVAALIAGEDK